MFLARSAEFSSSRRGRSFKTNYLVEELIAATVVAGMKLARRLFKSAPARALLTRTRIPRPDVQTDDEFLAAQTKRWHQHLSSRLHLAAWVPADSTWAVVDDQLRVHGLQGHARSMRRSWPAEISATPMPSTWMIARQASDLIRRP